MIHKVTESQSRHFNNVYNSFVVLNFTFYYKIISCFVLFYVQINEKLLDSYEITNYKYLKYSLYSLLNDTTNLFIARGYLTLLQYINIDSY